MSRFDQMEPVFFTPPSGKASGPRRLFKGGSSQDPAAYQKQVDASKEAARQAYYRGIGYGGAGSGASASPVNGKYGNTAPADPYASAADQREKNYSNMENDIINYHRDKLDRERTNSEKQLKFNLARQGLSGSSQDAYDRSELERKYLEGITDVGSKAKAASASARTGYEQAFNRGLQAINSGADATTQITSTLADIGNSMQSALEAGKGASWGGFFDDIASTTDTAKVNAQQALVKRQVEDPASSKLTSGGGSSKASGPLSY
jgi:hypothetical protein